MHEYIHIHGYTKVHVHATYTYIHTYIHSTLDRVDTGTFSFDILEKMSFCSLTCHTSTDNRLEREGNIRSVQGIIHVKYNGFIRSLAGMHAYHALLSFRVSIPFGMAAILRKGS